MTEFVELVKQLISNPVFWIVLLSYYLMASAIGAMEPPSTDSGKTYRYAYRFLQGFAANLRSVAQRAHVPGSEPAEGRKPM